MRNARKNGVDAVDSSLLMPVAASPERSSLHPNPSLVSTIGQLASRIASEKNTPVRLTFDRAVDPRLILSLLLDVAERRLARKVDFVVTNTSGLALPPISLEELHAIEPETVRRYLQRTDQGSYVLAASLEDLIRIKAQPDELPPTDILISGAPLESLQAIAGCRSISAETNSGAPAYFVTEGPQTDEVLNGLEEALLQPLQLNWAEIALGATADVLLTADGVPTFLDTERWPARFASVFENSANGDASNAASLRALCGGNRQLAALVSQLLLKYAKDAGGRTQICLIARSFGPDALRALAACLGVSRRSITIDVVLTDVPGVDAEIRNGWLPEWMVTSLSDWERNRIVTSIYRGGRFMMHDSLTAAMRWRLSELPKASIELEDFAEISVGTSTYVAMPDDMRCMFAIRPDREERHSLDVENTHRMFLGDSAYESWRGRTTGFTVNEAALLPPAIRSRFFSPPPGTYEFRLIPQKPDVDNRGGLDDAAVGQIDGNLREQNKTQPVEAPKFSGEETSGEPLASIERGAHFAAIVVAADLADHRESSLKPALKEMLPQLKSDGLLVVPRTNGDGLTNWLKQQSLKPARLRNAEAIHEGFNGARALARHRIDSPWAYPGSAELAEDDSRSLDEYNWLFTMGDGPRPESQGPPVLALKNVTLEFTNKTVLLDPTQMFKRTRPDRTNRALDRIDLMVQRGEVLGVVGRNGSGKSTLMRLLVGAYLPDFGTRWVDGETRLVTVGTGLNVELTGYANLMMMGQLIGMTKSEIEEQLDDIVEFTELGPALNRIVKHYSSGMRSRLAFAIATAKQADILILDEVFATGDKFFVEKSKARIRRLIDGAKAVIIVSHQVGLLRQIATRVVWIDKGRIVMDGDPEDVIQSYLEGA